MSTAKERSEYQADRRKYRKALGLCVTCGQRSSDHFYGQCRYCRAKEAIATAMKRSDRRINREQDYYNHYWLPISEAAKRYGWHRKTVRRWVKEGLIKRKGFAYRVTWISNADIKAYSEIVRRRYARTT